MLSIGRPAPGPSFGSVAGHAGWSRHPIPMQAQCFCATPVSPDQNPAE